MEEYKIYALKDPIDNVIKYVGVSKNVESRYKQHLYVTHNNEKSKWILELKKLDLKPEIIILHSIITDSKINAYNIEKEYIRKYKDTIYNIQEMGNTSRYPVAIDEETKEMLFKIMTIKGKKYSYLKIIKELCEDFLEEEAFVKSNMDKDILN